MKTPAVPTQIWCDWAHEHPEDLSVHAVRSLISTLVLERAVMAEQTKDLLEERALRERLADILTRTANALKGTPPPTVFHSWHDLPAMAARMRREAKVGMSTACQRPGSRNEHLGLLALPATGAAKRHRGAFRLGRLTQTSLYGN
jgi:hypothetical protein